MARTKGPLMSLQAAGNWGKGALQFRQGRDGTHAYRPADPRTVNQRPASPAQAAHRARYTQIKSAWRQVTTEERAAHEHAARASGQALSGWNYYLRALMAGQIVTTAALLTDGGELITTADGQPIIEG